MRAALRAPLALAGGVAVGLAGAQLVQPLAGFFLGLLVAASAGLLATASADRSRGLAWAAVSLAATTTTATGILGPLQGPDLAEIGAVAGLRAVLLAPLYALVPAPENALLAGIVLGDRADIPRDLRDAFAVSGTAHLLAISGSHLTIVAGAVALVLKGRVRPAATAALTLVAIGCYAVLVGPAPSVVRSTLMSVVAAAALISGRGGLAVNGLGAAVAAMVAADPRVITDIGFALSAAATAGLIALHRPLSDRMGRLPDALRDALALTIAASIPTIPLLVGTFGRIPLVSPLANLLAVPIVPPLMLFGAATSVVGAAWPEAARPVALGAFAFARALRAVAETCASLPLASVSVPAGPMSAIGATLLLIGGAVVLTRTGRLPKLPTTLHLTLLRPDSFPQRAAAALLAVALLAGSAVVTHAAAPSSAFSLRALDVGQGDAFLIESDGRYALIDGGPDPALIARRLGEALAPWQRRIDLIVLTHEHADHGAGLLAVIDRYDVGLAVEPAGMNDGPLVRAWSEHLGARGVTRRALAAGDVMRLGRLTLKVLGPGKDRRYEVPSLVIRVEIARSSILFMGDATDDAIADLLVTERDLRSDVYVPPHHGALSAQGAALVAAVRPDVAVLSVGASNRYGHPAPATLEALAGIPVYRTDRHGTIEIELDGSRPVVHTAKAGLPPDRRGSVQSAAAAR